MKSHLLFFGLILLCVVTHMIRTVYEILKHRKTISASRITFIIIFINMFLLWASWFSLGPLDPYKRALPELVYYTGILLAGSGVFLFLIALLTIKSLETYEGDLISHGIYSVIRHPMYLGFILLLAGMPLYTGSLVAAGLAIPFISNVLLWRHLEEKELVERFPGYTQYREKTYF